MTENIVDQDATESAGLVGEDDGILIAEKEAMRRVGSEEIVEEEEIVGVMESVIDRDIDIGHELCVLPGGGDMRRYSGHAWRYFAHSYGGDAGVEGCEGLRESGLCHGAAMGVDYDEAVGARRLVIGAECDLGCKDIGHERLDVDACLCEHIGLTVAIGTDLDRVVDIVAEGVRRQATRSWGIADKIVDIGGDTPGDVDWSGLVMGDHHVERLMRSDREAVGSESGLMEAEVEGHPVSADASGREGTREDIATEEGCGVRIESRGGGLPTIKIDGERGGAGDGAFDGCEDDIVMQESDIVGAESHGDIGGLRGEETSAACRHEERAVDAILPEDIETVAMDSGVADRDARLLLEDMHCTVPFDAVVKTERGGYALRASGGVDFKRDIEVAAGEREMINDIDVAEERVDTRCELPDGVAADELTDESAIGVGGDMASELGPVGHTDDEGSGSRETPEGGGRLIVPIEPDPDGCGDDSQDKSDETGDASYSFEHIDLTMEKRV